ncbi:MAG: hypothetical protein JWR24_2116 [Actinoallomurus sp.]|nr:hypothetical protein [Actinoallomurus sp.]
MLITAAFRIPRELVGSLWVYPLPARFLDEFGRLSERWQQKNEHAKAPYASLATALSAVTGQPVRLLPRTRWNAGDVMLITTRPIDPVILSTAVRVWERLARGEDTNMLGPLLDGITSGPQPIADVLDNPVRGRVVAESWVFDVLGWVIAERLSAQPIAFDHAEIPFEIDTSGTLVAWQNPITKPRRKGSDARALMKITPQIKTLPGLEDLICTLDVGLTRLEESLYQVKNVWIDHGRSTGGSALLRLPVTRRRTGDGWETIFRDYSGDVVAACGLDPLPWGENVLAEHPDLVRAGRSVNDQHPIGVGVGPRTYRQLVAHAEQVLGARPVCYEQAAEDRIGMRPRPVRVLAKAVADRLAPDVLDAALTAAGYERLRLVHLSASAPARERVRRELAEYRDAGTPLAAELGIVQPLTAKAEVVVYDVADLLAHDKVDRSELLTRAPLLKREDGALVLALVETEYAPEMVIPEDAKRPLRRTLAELGVASQFLAIPPHAMEEAIAEKERDYPAEAALKDLLMRCAGLTDDRMAKSVSLEPFPLAGDTWLVGVHVRKQSAPRRGARSRLVATMVAVHAALDSPWTFHLYVPGRGWLRAPEGLAAFHNGQIGAEIGKQTNAFADLRERVERALAQLHDKRPVPIVMMVDGDATRRIWSGLTDLHLKTGALPGDSLPCAADIAVVRVGTDDTAVPRPVHRTEGNQPRTDPAQPAAPGNQLYVHTGDDGTRSWLLAKTSKTYSAGIEGRCGALYTRFTLPSNRMNLQRKPWHAFTGTEFVVARSGPFGEDVVAALTARLCAQPLSWDGRTRWPVPLHLARIADQTHPGTTDESQHGA